MPSFVFTSGRKFSTTTSAFSARRRNTARPLGSLRLSVIARLLRCKFWKSEPWRGPPGCSPPASSINASILTTLAPQSASCRTQVGPARTRVRSSTVKRDRACEARGKGIQRAPERTEFLQQWDSNLRTFNTLLPFKFKNCNFCELRWVGNHSDLHVMPKAPMARPYDALGGHAEVFAAAISAAAIEARFGGERPRSPVPQCRRTRSEPQRRACGALNWGLDMGKRLLF